MAEITLKEYAKRHGIDASTARQRALRGAFTTAKKVGRDWVIDENEELVDHRYSGSSSSVTYYSYHVVATCEGNDIHIDNILAESEQAAVDSIRSINPEYSITNVYKMVPVHDWK